MGVGGVRFSRKKRYEGERFNVTCYEGVGGGPISRGKKRYVTLEWPPIEGVIIII